MISQEELVNLCRPSLQATITRLEDYLAGYSEVPSEGDKEFEKGDNFVPQRLKEHNHKASVELLKDCRTALEGMEMGTFGRCVDCGNKINKDRIIARPEVSRCKGCQEKKGLRIR